MSSNTKDYIAPLYCSFYYGRLLREESNKILEKRGRKNGLFLLRELVAEAGSYALSLCHEGIIHHYRIDRQTDGTVKIDKGRKFIGPVELIKHHQLELDGLITKPTIPCERPKGTQPIYYLFINDSEFYKLVNDEINIQLNKTKSTKSSQQYNQELNEARGRYRYKYERIVLKNLHFSQPWFKLNLDRENAHELLRKSGLINGKFLVRSASNKHEEYRISLCYQNDIKHYKIKTIKSNENDNNDNNVITTRYCLDGGLEFDSITQLVDYYHRNADGLADILRIPLIQMPSRLDPVWLSSLALRSSIINNNNNGGGHHQNKLNAMLNNEGIYSFIF
jgi:hypothetical protein